MVQHSKHIVAISWGWPVVKNDTYRDESVHPSKDHAYLSLSITHKKLCRVQVLYLQSHLEQSCSIMPPFDCFKLYYVEDITFYCWYLITENTIFFSYFIFSFSSCICLDDFCQWYTHRSFCVLFYLFLVL